MKIYEFNVNPDPICEIGTKAIIDELVKDGKINEDFSEITFSKNDFQDFIFETLKKGHYAGASEVIGLLNQKNQ